VEVAVLSHGHMDHLGGMKALVDKIGKQGLDLVVHPEAFRSPRFKKVSEDIRIDLPSLTRELIDAAGVNPVESDRPMTLLDDTVLFLGRVPRRTDFEQGVPDMRYLDDGEEKQDDFPDDTGIAINVKDHGLVVLTGCAHSGIVNTVHHAREASGEDRVLAVMGGFHLSGPVNADKVVPTIDALETFDPRYVVPTHCTGRSTINEFERRLPDRFLLNMAGTRLVWPA
jgi:7,8-dihydropterin-6-yl-methyl-4-(beta-D-ribofuranosyl)aminobenzene 5'-phosphate synthase